ncbi:aquaporin-like isoform X1 [Drosophila miranda]|uniref:aquaporin-like isoform X1 n=1 Tax=Drosophila miranda TaxID=7229 RepID=UPI0007E6F44F|nr:aquaporin-like isoform X1 [Drosophila miranda]
MSVQQQPQQALPTIAAILNHQQKTGVVGAGAGGAMAMPSSAKPKTKSRSSCWLLQPRQLNNICIVFAELIATAMLMFLGCMGCIQNSFFSNSNFQSALNFGFVVLICIQCFGCVCGAHLNPAVTLANYIYNMISLPMAISYFVAQMVGAFIGYGLLKAVMPESAIYSSSTSSGVCVTSLHSSLTGLQGVVIEFLITSALIAICCGVWDPRNAKNQDSVPVRFALAIACLSLTAGQFTGASMNPARSFAPAIWNGAWENHWIYWVGPLAGALVSSLIYKYAFRREVQAQEEQESTMSTKRTSELEFA